jgi:energy-coupling factor transporter ATP-binding protein EcfA2
MRIKSIALEWFRGAADRVALELDCKSLVVYGSNGSGKSSFVDAVEYVLSNGRVRHLAHEYSGKHQEKGIPNTHKPENRKATLNIKFKDDSELRTEIRDNGSFMRTGAEAVGMDTWDYRRTVLRQDEVAAFIQDTKGDKYSALLPLLGLDQMEVAAENLRQLAKAVEKESRLSETRVALKQVEATRKAAFGTQSAEQILETIGDLHTKYCADNHATIDPVCRCKELEIALDTRIAMCSADDRRYVALKGAAELDLNGHVDAVRAASMKFAGAAEPLIAEQLDVLQKTVAFVDKLGDTKEVKCPACGRLISTDDFQAHVTAERNRLKEIIDIFDTRKAAIGTLCDTVKSLKSNLGKADVKFWRDELAVGALADNLAHLDGLNAEVLRASCREEGLKAIEGKLLPLIAAAAAASEHAPPDAKALSTAKRTAEAARTVIVGKDQAVVVARAEALVGFINSLEQGVREQIRLRSQTVIDEISADVQTMWGTLHPGEAIEDVRLYLPDNADKAIDIRLKFYGVEQDSPRLTLSEGNRNSLGLCIFLSMAKRQADKDRPLFLDDVVVSLDRDHRGMIRVLLEKDFSERQVVVLTHDREWYTELRQQLDAKCWAFKVLLPWETPAIGIRWSHKITTFDDARVHVNDRPDSAGNDARKIMDVELSLIAERLQIRMPYLRADKNDKRMAHDFLERFIAHGKRCFQVKAGTDYAAHTTAIAAWEEADRLLVSWANRASHTFDLVPAEATKLIDACEKALEFFKCISCGKGVWFSDAASSESIQCHCGQIRWRYGKG